MESSQRYNYIHEERGQRAVLQKYNNRSTCAAIPAAIQTDLLLNGYFEAPHRAMALTKKSSKLEQRFIGARVRYLE